MFRKKLNSEMKIGFLLVVLYIFWFLIWIVYQRLIAGTILSPYIPTFSISDELIPPLGDYLLGSDIYGRSIIEILSMGLSYSLKIGLMVTTIAASIGIVIAYLSLRSNLVFRKILDILINLIFIFPSILLAILFMSVVGKSIWGLTCILVITGWPGYARIARGEIQRVLSLPFVEGAKSIGVGEIRLFFVYILPAILPQLIIHMVLGISGVIINEAVLGFLGLGGSEYSWGAMLAMAKDVLLEAPYIVIILSVIMGGLIIALNLVGDGLRDYLDPKEN